MKNLLTIFFVLIGFSLSSSLDDNTNPKSCNVAELKLLDCLDSSIKNSPKILYTYGHYGFSWSMVVKKDTTLQTFTGRIDYLGNSCLTENLTCNQFDSIRSFSKYKTLIQWGIDTLPNEINQMKAIGQEYSGLTNSNLLILDSIGETVFNSNGNITFSGPDSLSFNSKLHHLRLIMRWLSCPQIRHYIPDSIIFSSKPQ